MSFAGESRAQQRVSDGFVPWWCDCDQKVVWILESGSKFRAPDDGWFWRDFAQATTAMVMVGFALSDRARGDCGRDATEHAPVRMATGNEGSGRISIIKPSSFKLQFKGERYFDLASSRKGIRAEPLSDFGVSTTSSSATGFGTRRRATCGTFATLTQRGCSFFKGHAGTCVRYVQGIQGLVTIQKVAWVGKAIRAATQRSLVVNRSPVDSSRGISELERNP